MMRLRHWMAPGLALLGALAVVASPAAAQDFYRGKTVTIVVGFPPGGGFDANARLLARHIGRHIPGNPTVLVVNAPGAGSMTGVMRLDVNLPTDGTAIDEFNFGLIGNSLLDPARTKLDFRSYRWIGSISEDVTTCYLWRADGPKTLAEMKAGGHYTFGQAGIGTSDDINTKILRRVFGVDITEAMGYAGSAEVRIAIEQGELSGDCGTWSSLPESWPKNPKFHPVLRTAAHRPEDMPAEVAYAVDAAPDEASRKVVRFLDADGDLGRPFIASSKVPPERIRILRQAFADTMQDKDFLAEAKSLRLPVAPRGGAEAETIIKDIYATPPDVIAAARKVAAE